MYASAFVISVVTDLTARIINQLIIKRTTKHRVLFHLTVLFVIFRAGQTNEQGIARRNDMSSCGRQFDGPCLWCNHLANSSV